MALSALMGWVSVCPFLNQNHDASVSSLKHPRVNDTFDNDDQRSSVRHFSHFKTALTKPLCMQRTSPQIHLVPPWTTMVQATEVTPCAKGVLRSDEYSTSANSIAINSRSNVLSNIERHRELEIPTTTSDRSSRRERKRPNSDASLPAQKHQRSRS